LAAAGLDPDEEDPDEELEPFDELEGDDELDESLEPALAGVGSDFFSEFAPLGTPEPDRLSVR
jgi:hypothetical protein